MADVDVTQVAAAVCSESSGEIEVFDFQVEPNPNPIELFELTLPRPPQGTWREKFDIRADVRFAHIILKFDNVFVRVIESLLARHASDERIWPFLLEHQVKRERVGKCVSLIIDSWETTQPNPKVAGTELRMQLLRRGGNPYVTVRVRLLRELVARIGPSDEVFELSKGLVESDGYLSSGILAISILAEHFANDRRAEEFLKQLLQRPNWFGFRSQVVSALLEGFDSTANRQHVEAAISDRSLEKYQRSGMLEAYGKADPKNPGVLRFIKRSFESDTEPEVRAAAIRSRSKYGDLAGKDGLETLKGIAVEDKDYQVRYSALDALASRMEDTGFLRERALKDQNEQVRSAAVRFVDRLGYKEWSWFVSVFKDDSADVVRSAALDWLSRKSGKTEEKEELHSLLVDEMKRSDVGRAAARAADEALKRWPNDPVIYRLTVEMVARLPEDEGGWKMYLRSMLSKIDQKR